MSTSCSASSPLSATVLKSLTDCPQCQGVCVGATILPCGHLICRKCLHHILQPQGPPQSCHVCGRLLQVEGEEHTGDVNWLSRHLGVDPVVMCLAQRWLAAQEGVTPSGHTSASLQDLGEGGSSVTGGEGAETIMGLDSRVALHIFSDFVDAIPSASDAAGPDSPNQDSGRRQRDRNRNTREQENGTTEDEGPQSGSDGSGTDSDKEWQRWTKTEVKKLHQATVEQEHSITKLEEILRLTQQALEKRQAQKQVMHTYSQALQQFQVCGQTEEARSYVVRAKNGGAEMVVRTESLGKHLCEVRKSEGIEETTESLVARLMHTNTPTAGTPGQLKIGMSQQTVSHSLPLSSESTPPARPQTPTICIQAPTTHKETPIANREIASTRNVVQTTHTRTATSSPHGSTRSSRRPSRRHLHTRTSSPPSPLSPTPPSPTPRDPENHAAVPSFMLTPTSKGDKKEPAITAIISTRGGPLVLADAENKKVKVIHPEYPFASPYPAVRLDEAPYGLGELEKERLIAVTTGTKHLYLLSIGTDFHPSVESRFRTERKYTGIACHPDGYLIVGCRRSESGTARVDVLTRWGHVVRTVADSGTIAGLDCVGYLSLLDRRHLLISDSGNHTVVQVELSCGQVSETLVHSDLCYPRQVCGYRGSVYVASAEGQCVLVRGGGSDGQRWCRWLHGPQHSVSGYVWPWGVCVTGSGMVVVVWRKGLDSMVVGYQLG